MSSLLEEAIVDAKALKEAALKNAENAVLERYSGEVKSALDTLLEQEDILGDEEGDPELMEFAAEVPMAFATEEIDGPAPEEIIEIDFDALKARLEEEEEVVGGEDLIDATGMADAIALEEDDDITQMEKDEDDAEASTAVTAGGEEEGYLGLKEEEEDDEDISLTEEMLADLIEELVVDMTPRPQGWASVNSADNSIEQANNDAMGAAQAAHLEEEEIEEEVETAPDVVSDAGLFETKVSKLTESNKELRALIMEAKKQLTKLNLENAKLVYQNKALNSASLNERQKNQIAEAVQTATSVEEAGMIFETIQNAVGTTNSNNSSRPQTLREAVQRPTSLLINSKKNNTATRDPKMGRMLRLAGLNK
jgi:hypothetical protein